MKVIGDFHIHGPYAQACSKNTTLDKLETYSKIKGLDVLGTGDFQHPKWNGFLNKELTEDENGILWTKNKFPFIWQTEISLAYSQGGKGRRVHLVVLAPGKEVVNQIIDTFSKRWRIDYDGRPIFGISCIEFTEMLMNISKDIEIIPAHHFTSWFGLHGSKSGFDSVEECFGDKAKYIHAIETGMSSDPEMNRRISSLDKYNLVSFSDPHTFFPWRIGREATIFDLDELTYSNIVNSIRTGKGLKGTIETPPEYGKYHYDGHRNCNVFLTPEESKKLKGICPKCKKELTLGVAYRVEELADRKEPVNVPYFVRLIPLTELISVVYSLKQLQSKKVWSIYNKLINEFGNELNILLNTSYEELKKLVDEKLAKLIIMNREDKLSIKPGYDGVYGSIILKDEDKIVSQKSLLEF
ncbi:MAG: DNA helicase UvrD [Candidatus Woesearchaeota archaeon]|nr:MAG: DNA helicase UvrD [Candidatus Woesearchaeota archaeon]